MLLVITVVVLHETLRVGIDTSLVLQDSQQVVGSSDQVNGTRGFRVLLFALVPLLLLVDSVLLKVELVGQAKVRIVADLNPRAITVTLNTNAKHAILTSPPWA
jgi:hypothetical protein